MRCGINVLYFGERRFCSSSKEFIHFSSLYNLTEKQSNALVFLKYLCNNIQSFFAFIKNILKWLYLSCRHQMCHYESSSCCKSVFTFSCQQRCYGAITGKTRLIRPKQIHLLTVCCQWKCKAKAKCVTFKLALSVRSHPNILCLLFLFSINFW